MQYEELWEGEEIVYKCKNETLVINNNPDQKTVKYKCRVSGRYNSPFGDEVCCAEKREKGGGEKVFFQEWPVCTKKPIRPEIMRAIRLMTSKFDKNIEYRWDGDRSESETVIIAAGMRCTAAPRWRREAPLR